MEGRWVQIEQGSVPLRCWWNNPQRERKHVVLVLPEVFGINSWVKSIVDRLAEKGIPSLAMPLFARTGPELDLGYNEDDLVEGGRHKDQTTTQQILDYASNSLTLLKLQYSQTKNTVTGFCLVGTQPLSPQHFQKVSFPFDFYGAGVAKTWPGGGSPSLELFGKTSGKLTCIYRTGDPLIPQSERKSIKEALSKENPSQSSF